MCFDCGKPGHIAKDCWLKEENKDKGPANDKKPGEQGAAAVETGSKVEFLLCTMNFPTVPELLNDPDVWIRDVVPLQPTNGSQWSGTKSKLTSQTQK